MKNLLKKLYVEDTTEIDIDVSEDNLSLNGEKVHTLCVDVVSRSDYTFSNNRFLYAVMALLLIALIVSAVAGSWLDVLVITAIMLANMLSVDKDLDIHIQTNTRDSSEVEE